MEGSKPVAATEMTPDKLAIAKLGMKRVAESLRRFTRKPNRHQRRAMAAQQRKGKRHD